jgi:hypothetical protein
MAGKFILQLIESEERMHRKCDKQIDTYRIRLKGALNPAFTDWLGDIIIIPHENGETLLIGKFTDQPALRGFLDQLWNFNFTVLSVEKVDYIKKTG